MPLINFANPVYVIVALVLFILCVVLANQFKKNTVPCLVLLVFLAILVGHTVELAALNNATMVPTLAICIAVDEVFIFASFLMFLWYDRIQVDTDKKVKKSGKKSTTETKADEKVIEKDGLDVLWKKV